MKISLAIPSPGKVIMVRPVWRETFLISQFLRLLGTAMKIKTALKTEAFRIELNRRINIEN